MTNLTVNTSFNTNLKFNVDTLGKRIVATVIDWLVIGLYIVLIVLLLSTFNIDIDFYNHPDGSRVAWGFYSVLSLPILFYTLVSEVVSGGYTIGKFLMGLKVVKLDGFQPTFSEFFIRWVFRMVDLYLILLLMILFDFGFLGSMWIVSGAVGMIVIAASRRGQRLGDMVAGTTIIKTRQKQNINITILEEVSSAYKPLYPQVVKLSDNDARIIKDTFERAKRMNDSGLMLKLVKKLEEVMHVTSGQPPEMFIKTVLLDFNYYTQKM